MNERRWIVERLDHGQLDHDQPAWVGEAAELVGLLIRCLIVLLMHGVG